MSWCRHIIIAITVIIAITIAITVGVAACSASVCPSQFSIFVTPSARMWERARAVSLRRGCCCFGETLVGHVLQATLEQNKCAFIHCKQLPTFRLIKWTLDAVALSLVITIAGTILMVVVHGETRLSPRASFLEW